MGGSSSGRWLMRGAWRRACLDEAFNLTPPAPAEAIWAKLPEG